MSLFSQLLLYAAALCILIFCYAVMRLVSIHSRLDGAVRGKLTELQERLSSFEHRLSLIQEHALDYMNSISGEGSRALYQLQQIIASQRELIAQIESHLASQDINALRKADRLLEETLHKATPVGHGSKSSAAYGKLLENWESRSEELLQTLGLDISLASESSRSSGLPKRRKRRGTSMSLKEAGILAAIRNQKPPPQKQ